MTILSRLKRAMSRKTDVVTFSCLDYWTMLELFDRIPLHDLVRLNGLASWWSGYVDKVCLTKRSIVVLCGCKTYQSGDDDTNDKVDVLKVVTIDSTTADRLGHLLPNITSLELIIAGRQSFCLSDVTNLINQWSHQLDDLKLEFSSTFVSVDANSENDQFYGLLLALNRITTLRRLTIRSDLDQCRLKEPIDLPILTQLEYFYFRSGSDDFTKLRTSLVQYAGPNLALRQIALPTFGWYDHMHLDWDLEPQLLSKFTMLRIIEATRAEWSLFPSLDFADHLLGTLESRSRFMEHISEMQHSHAHTVNIAFLISPLFDRNSDQVLARPPPLQFITKLQLTVWVWQKCVINLYSNFKSLKLDHRMLPNVQTVHLKYSYLRMNSCLLRDDFFNIPHLILYGMLMLRIQRDFPNSNCTFERGVYEVRNLTNRAQLHMAY